MSTVALRILSAESSSRTRRLPPWLKRPLPSDHFPLTRRVIEESGVATVCAEARCPNLSECWSNKTATFMIMGDHCTRRCHYCAVSTARPEPLEADEPSRLAEAVRKLGLKHVVITAVARDDLADEGAVHYAECIRAIHREHPDATVEILPADMHARPELIRLLCEAKPEIFNHNIETVERLTPIIRPQAKYRRSLEMIRLAREIDADIRASELTSTCQRAGSEQSRVHGVEDSPWREAGSCNVNTPNPLPHGRGSDQIECGAGQIECGSQTTGKMITKSGIMVGLGETWDELIQTFRDLRSVDCDVLTIGQYLQPTPDHAPVEKFYPPEEFDQLADQARALGFLAVYSGPFIRSSYNAGKLFEEILSTQAHVRP